MQSPRLDLLTLSQTEDKSVQLKSKVLPGFLLLQWIYADPSAI
jgi:hypothetical protein